MLYFNSRSSLKVNRPEHLAHIPQVLDLNQLDQKTGKVFRELIDEQFIEALPFVLSYDSGPNFANGSSFDMMGHIFEMQSRSGSSSKTAPVVFFSIFPGQTEFGYIGSTEGQDPLRINMLDLFIRTARREDPLTHLTYLYRAYHDDFENATLIKEKIDELCRFHFDHQSKSSTIQGPFKKVVTNQDVVFGNAMAFLKDQTPLQNITGLEQLQLLTAKFYRPAYFPIALCYYYGRGEESNPDASIFWMERALGAGDPRAIEWSQKKNFKFNDVEADFQLCINMQDDAQKVMDAKRIAEQPSAKKTQIQGSKIHSILKPPQGQGSSSSSSNPKTEKKVTFADVPL